MIQKHYIIVFIVCILSIFLLLGFIECAEYIISPYQDNIVKNDWIGKKTVDYPSDINLLDKYQYNLIETVYNLSPHKNVILIGGSQVLWGAIPNYTMQQCWTIRNLGMSNAHPYSDKIILNNIMSIHPIVKDDIVIFHIFVGYFEPTSKQSDFTRQSYEKLSYIVDDGGNLTPKVLSPLQRFYYYKTFQYYGLKSWLFEKYLNIPAFLDHLKENTNCKGEKLNNDSAASNKTEVNINKWSNYTHEVMFPGNETNDFMNLVSDYNQKSNVIVINLYTPSWMKAIPKEKEYEEWFNNNLTPFLNNQNIPIFDFSNSIPDNEYFDDVHLNVDGRIRYTQLLNKKLMNFMSLIEPVQ